MHWLQSRQSERSAYSSPHLIWRWSSFSVLKSHTSGQSRTALLHHCCRLGGRSRERRFKRFQNINILCTPSRHHFVSLPVHTSLSFISKFLKNTVHTTLQTGVFSLSAVMCLHGTERKRRSRLFPLKVLEIIEFQFYDRNRDNLKSLIGPIQRAGVKGQRWQRGRCSSWREESAPAWSSLKPTVWSTNQ